MANIDIRPSSGTWVVRAGGAVLGESARALVLHEGDYPPVVYFPRDDIAMEFLDVSEKVTTCPWKGDARHYSIVTKSTVLAESAWSYEDPKPDVEAIRSHIAFYQRDDVTVEEV